MITALREKARELRAAIDKTAGVIESIQNREQDLMVSVGLAKGRIDRKDEVSSHLDQLQAQAHERNVGSYERLLSGLVADILPNKGTVGLDLSTERGLPALDIFVRKGEDEREDILDGNGGALTNVVCFGLRAIATAKAHQRMFMALDETDCWIEPDRIESFYSVVRQMTSSIGLQCLFIAHHDISRFSDGIAISRLLDGGDEGPVIEHDPMAAKWENDEQSGIRFIRLVNFMSHKDTLLKLSPGMNALLGKNNLGKSVLMRALRAASYGEVSDTDIRHGEKRLEAHFGLEGGRSLVFSREKKRNPVNLWELVDEEGHVIEENGTRYETGGRNVPNWVNDILQMPLMDGLDIHISHQKKPVFLLADNPSRRAAVLSVGQESSHIQTMIARHKEWCTADNAMIRNGEKEVGQIRAQIEALTPVLELATSIETVEQGLKGIEGGIEKGERFSMIIQRLNAASSRKDALVAKVEALSGIPETMPSIDDMQPALNIAEKIESRQAQVRKLNSQIQTLSDMPADFPQLVDAGILTSHLSRLQAADNKKSVAASSLNALSTLPEGLPEITETGGILSIGKRLKLAIETCSKFTENVSSNAVEMEACRSELSVELESGGNICPTCHQGTHVDHILAAAE